MRRKPGTDIKEWLLAQRIIGANGCWLWPGAHHSGGYGIVRYQGKPVDVHRLSMHLFRGFDLLSGRPTYICHACNVPGCYNPDHLYVGTAKANSADAIASGTTGRGMARINRAKTHCPAGHEYTHENTYVSRRGYRHCRACRRIKDRRNYVPADRDWSRCMNGHDLSVLGRYKSGACIACARERSSEQWRKQKKAYSTPPVAKT